MPPLTAEEWARAGQRDAVEQVILVDENDRELGAAGKLDVHQDGGQLHRAFSILVFNADGALLLQRRADGKYHFASRWSNTCCGHPRPGESTQSAAERRLQEEFGIDVPLVERNQLIYRAEDQGSGLTEHEFLHIFHGHYASDPHPDPSEVGAWRWMPVPAIRRAMKMRPDLFTPWFHLVFEQLVLDDGA